MQSQIERDSEEDRAFGGQTKLEVFDNLPELDSRSFHVFESEGAKLLFDRRTATVSEIDELLYRVFHQIQNGESLTTALKSMVMEFVDFEVGEFVQVVEAMKLRGFFVYTPVDHQEQDRFIDGLLRHKPKRIQLLMAQGCNLGCRYCYAWRNGSNQKNTLMSWEVAKASVDYLVKKSAERTDLQVTFFGGEPLLNYEVIQQLVEYCKSIEAQTDKRFLFELITNGTLLTPDKVAFIVKHKFLLFISIDGWKEMHNYNRPSMSGEDMYDTIVKHAVYANLEYQKNGLPAVKVRANLTNKFHDSFAVGNYLASLGFKVIGVGAIEPLNHSDSSPSALTEDQMDELHETGCRTLQDAARSLVNGEKIDYYVAQQLQKSLNQVTTHDLKGITCGIARNTQIVDNKGNLFPCHRYEGMENYIIGNVLAGGNSREATLKYYQAVNRNATARCHSCWVRDYCGGGCAWLLSKKDGHLSDPSERECNRRRKTVERALSMRYFLVKHAPERLPSDSAEFIKNWTWGDAERFNQNGQTDSVNSTQTGSCNPASCGSQECSCGNQS